MSGRIFTFVPTVSALVDGSAVPVRHTNMAVYARDGSGRTWVRKRQANMGCEEFLGEALGWLLANALEAPVPDSAIFVDKDGDPSWLSECVPSVVHWDPARVNEISNADGLGAVLALDAIILNADRHGGNLLLQADATGDGLHVWAIDHGAALIGSAKDIDGYREEITDPRNLARGIPVDLVEGSALQAARRACSLAPLDVRGMAQGACLQAKEPAADLIADVLAERCAKAEKLVTAYLEQIRRLQR